MSKKKEKETRNGSKKNHPEIKNLFSGVLSREKDNAARIRRDLKEKLEGRIKMLEEQKIRSPGKNSFVDDGEFEHIIKKEVKQKEDRVVWKAYSKRGGISDILVDIRKAVERPSANAFEFHDEEGMYTIFITLNNTYIRRLEVLCREMCSECEQIGKMEDSNLRKEREELQKIYHNLCTEKEKLSQKSFQQQLKTALCAKGDEQEKELKRLEGDLNSYERKREDYADSVKAYQERLAFFTEECRKQESYESQYHALLEKLTWLGEIRGKEHLFHILTISPEGEEELRQYMETACEFCKWTLHVTEEYPL